MIMSKPLTKAELNRTASARAKELCRERGLIWDWCESYEGFSKRKRDLFGLFDLVYFDGSAIVGVQVTQHNGNARFKKMLGKRQPKETTEQAQYRRRCLWAWLVAGNRAEVWDYRHRKKGGQVVAIDRIVMPLELADLDDGTKTIPSSIGDWMGETTKEIL